MIVTYVGFVGGWTKQLSERILPAGLGRHRRGTVATFFTFSVLSVHPHRRPLVEATHATSSSPPAHRHHRGGGRRDPQLAVFFAWHVLWPAGFSGRFECSPPSSALPRSSPCSGSKPVLSGDPACGAAGLVYTFIM